MKYISIKQWSLDDRPREKLLAKGVKNLTDTELLAILIGTGTRETSAVELSRLVLQQCNNQLSLLGKQTVAQLKKIKGIGEAKAITIVAALELGKRRGASDIIEKPRVTSSKDAFSILHTVLSDLEHEEFWVLFMNRSNAILESYKLSQGGISGTVIDNRLILKKAIDLLASSVIIAHNHPSGNLNPSNNDTRITEKLKTALSHLDIKLLDHIIVADNSYFSYSDEGLL